MKTVKKKPYWFEGQLDPLKNPQLSFEIACTKERIKELIRVVSSHDTLFAFAKVVQQTLEKPLTDMSLAKLRSKADKVIARTAKGKA